MPKNARSQQDDDFINLSLIIDALKDQWRVFSVVLIGTVIVGLVACFLVPSRWQAEATLRVGEVASMALGQQTGSDTDLIESVGETIARMQLAQFYDAVLNSPSLRNIDSNEVALFKKTFKAIPIKGTYFIHVSASGRSPQNVKKMLEVTIQTLLAIHDKKMQMSIRQIPDRVENLSNRIAMKQKSRDRLKQVLQSGNNADTVRALDLLDRQEASIQELTDERSVVAGMLHPPQTFNTAVLDAVRVESKPHFPRLRYFLSIAMLVGSLMGILGALYQYRKKQNSLV